MVIFTTEDGSSKFKKVIFSQIYLNHLGVREGLRNPRVFLLFCFLFFLRFSLLDMFLNYIFFVSFFYTGDIIVKRKLLFFKKRVFSGIFAGLLI
jgi:hypothetical protein